MQFEDDVLLGIWIASFFFTSHNQLSIGQKESECGWEIDVLPLCLTKNRLENDDLVSGQRTS